MDFAKDFAGPSSLLRSSFPPLACGTLRRIFGHGPLRESAEQSLQEMSRLIPKRRRPPSQTWRTFLDNHVKELISIDFLTVPTATFRVLFVLVVLAHHRRRVVHFNVTEHPTAVWTAQQIIEALFVPKCRFQA